MSPEAQGGDGGQYEARLALVCEDAPERQAVIKAALEQIGFAMLGGMIVFSHLPDRLSLAGMGMIAVCGAAGAWLTVRERRLAE